MNVLIVDDDEFLVKKISEGLDWTKLGVDMTFTANNIRQAKEILQKFTIQLLITDIEMPLGSGLELAKWVQTQQMECKYILISSYASFAYAQEAIKLQTSQYLLKPFSNEELSRVIVEVIGTIKRKENDAGEEQQKQKERFWTDCLACCKHNNVTGELTKRFNSIYMEQCNLFVMLIKNINGINKNPQFWELNRQQIRDLAQTTWKEKGITCETVLDHGEMQWVLIGKCSHIELPAMAELLALALHNVSSQSYIYYKAELENSLSDTFNTLKELVNTVCNAVPGDSLLLDISEWNKRRDSILEDYYLDWKEEIENVDNCKALGDKIIACIETEHRHAKITISTFEHLRMVLSQLVFLWLEQQNLQSFMFFSKEEFSVMYENSMLSLEDMRSFIRWIFEKMDGYRHTDTRRESVVKKIKNYIEKNLKEELTRKELAGVVYLSEDYVARIFNEETGMSLSNYVAQRRMKKAQEYLLNTDWGIANIAMEVGYTNFSYFSKTFRGYAGCTPNEYRRKKENTSANSKKQDINNKYT